MTTADTTGTTISTITGTTITGSIGFADWTEQEVASSASGPRTAHASVANTFTGGIEAVRTACDYSIAYTTGHEGVFTGVELVTGGIEGRHGTFVLEQRGTFAADGTIHCAFTVVPGSGTEELAGLTGTGEYVCRTDAESIPYSFSYRVQ
ncbi:uncharacterized protein DUF3224 [Kitasatospora sp. SolWspMP-SS2h]|uniref:DUF3224 domain-containing protein n=1 Tax=Kitasatospora sp. SolWspMP-SS2h TaxID=1305729 RepID=UPI000DB953A4|nr:DUF3224 domain-containing protein [Kitasatospora sp. SolWspMP-SS2h]RAJ44707.1 uncharacterized protein DUF3224 [Kitasatospora sp. SolWspMP-SS2h]